MLKTLRLHNFKTFLNAEIAFTQRHLLIGKNNSGKTNLSTALQFLGLTASVDLATAAEAIAGGIDEMLNWTFKGTTIELSCTCVLPIEGGSYEFTYDLGLEPTEATEPARRGQMVPRVVSEKLLIDGPGYRLVSLLDSDGRKARVLQEQMYEDTGETQISVVSAPRDGTMLSKMYRSGKVQRVILFRDYLASWGYFALSPEHMRYGWRQAPSALRGLVPRGDNLATALFHMKNMDEQRYRRVVEHSRIVEPNVEAINFIPAPDQTPVPFVALLNRSKASWRGLSDGTLRCLGLGFIIEFMGSLIAAEGSPAPVTVIEEPENGIYPGQLRQLFDLFEEWAPQGQFIFTSHSPYFINLFDGSRESVTILRRKNERTEIGLAPPADDDPERELLAEQYSMELLD